MTVQARLTRLEAHLGARDRLLVWLKQEQSCGGYLETVLSRMKSHVRPRALVGDPEAAFLYYLAMKCNHYLFEVLAPERSGMLLNRILGLYARLWRAGSSPDPEEIAAVKKILMDFFEEGLILQSAINGICADHFDGHQVLFSDAARRLADRLKICQQIVEGYNGLAPHLGFEKLDLCDMEMAISAQANKRNQVMVSLARAEACGSLGYEFAADSLLVPIVEREIDSWFG